MIIRTDKQNELLKKIVGKDFESVLVQVLMRYEYVDEKEAMSYIRKLKIKKLNKQNEKD